MGCMLVNERNSSNKTPSNLNELSLPTLCMQSIGVMRFGISGSPIKFKLKTILQSSSRTTAPLFTVKGSFFSMPQVGGFFRDKGHGKVTSSAG
jgi:hypothetical protein